MRLNEYKTNLSFPETPREGASNLFFGEELFHDAEEKEYKGQARTIKKREINDDFMKNEEITQKLVSMFSGQIITIKTELFDISNFFG